VLRLGVPPFPLSACYDLIGAVDSAGELPDVLLWVIGLGLLAWAIYSQKVILFILAGAVLAIKLASGTRF